MNGQVYLSGVCFKCGQIQNMILVRMPYHTDRHEFIKERE